MILSIFSTVVLRAKIDCSTGGKSDETTAVAALEWESPEENGELASDDADANVS